MSRSATIARLRNENPGMTSEEAVRIVNGDTAAIARLKRNQTWTGMAQGLGNAQTNFNEGRAYFRERFMRLFFMFIGFGFFNAYWLLFMPKPPLTQAFLNWLVGKSLPF